MHGTHATGRSPDRATRSRAALVLVAVAGLVAFFAFPAIKRALGINKLDLWFLDSYAILASNDAVRAGIDPDVPNPLDVLDRPHSYTDWWFMLGRIPLTRDDNFVVGGTWVLSFLAVALLTLRPRDSLESACFALALLSPAVLLAINRANNDLVIFAILGLGILPLAAGRSWGWGVALAAIALATGLKIYPVVAAAVLLLMRPISRMAIACSVALVVLGAVLWDVWPAIGRGLFTLPQTLYTFGADVLLRDLQVGGRVASIASVVLICAAAWWLARTRRTEHVGAVLADEAGRQVLFALGAVLLIACFISGASFSYRLIFALWLLPWWLTRARGGDLPARQIVCARLGVALVFAVLWLDGLYCLATNAFIGPMPLEQLLRWQLRWRLVTQPLAWVLIALAAGWWLEAALATAREVRRAKTETV